MSHSCGLQTRPDHRSALRQPAQALEKQPFNPTRPSAIPLRGPLSQSRGLFPGLSDLLTPTRTPFCQMASNSEEMQAAPLGQNDHQPPPPPPPTQFQPIQTSQPQPPLSQSQQPSSNHPGGGAPSSQTPGHPSFRRQRASRACEVSVISSVAESRRCANSIHRLVADVKSLNIAQTEAPRSSSSTMHTTTHESALRYENFKL